MSNPLDQQKTAQLVSDVLMLATNTATPAGEAQARRDFITFCAWLISENMAGRKVDFHGLTQGALCPEHQSFCPIKGKIQQKTIHENVTR